MVYGNGGYGQGMTIINEAAFSPKPQRLGQISEQAERLAKNVETLHAVIGDIEARLATVLQPNTPMDPQGGQPAQPLVGFAEALRDRNSGIEAAVARLQSIFNRVEL